MAHSIGKTIAELRKAKGWTQIELAEEIKLHISDTCGLYGENHGMKLSRKLVHDYLKGRGFKSSYRAEASQLASFDDLDVLLQKLCNEYANYP